MTLCPYSKSTLKRAAVIMQFMCRWSKCTLPSVIQFYLSFRLPLFLLWASKDVFNWKVYPFILRSASSIINLKRHLRSSQSPFSSSSCVFRTWSLRFSQSLSWRVIFSSTLSLASIPRIPSIATATDIISVVQDVTPAGLNTECETLPPFLD